MHFAIILNRTAVNLIVCYWKTQTFQMYSDLVCPPSFRVTLDYGLAILVAIKLEPSQCIFCFRFEFKGYFLCRTASHDSVDVRLTVDAIFAHNFFIFVADTRKISLHSSVVHFTNFIPLQCLSKLIGRFSTFREKYYSTCLTIKPMDCFEVLHF